MDTIVNVVHITAVLFYVGSIAAALIQGRYDFFLGMVGASGIFLIANECRAYKQQSAATDDRA